MSAKFTRERLESDLAAGALELESFLTDDESRFALSVMRPAASPPPPLPFLLRAHSVRDPL